MDAQTLSEHIRDVERLKSKLTLVRESSSYELESLNLDLTVKIKEIDRDSIDKEEYHSGRFIALDDLLYQRQKQFDLLAKRKGKAAIKVFNQQKTKLVGIYDSYIRCMRKLHSNYE